MAETVLIVYKYYLVNNVPSILSSKNPWNDESASDHEKQRLNILQLKWKDRKILTRYEITNFLPFILEISFNV